MISFKPSAPASMPRLSIRSTLFSKVVRLPKMWGMILGLIKTNTTCLNNPAAKHLSMKWHRALLLRFNILLLLLFSLASCSGRLSNCETPKELFQKVSQTRGLKISSDVACYETRSPKELKKFLSETIDRRLTPEELEAEALMLKLLGAIPPKYDYKNELLTLYAQRLSAFYSPEFKRFVLYNTSGNDFNAVVAHELTHALQDQRYDLMSLTGNSLSIDLITARSAIFEGDANITMRRVNELPWCSEEAANLKHNLAILEVIRSESTTTPKFLELQIAFPYFLGERYLCSKIRAARKSNGGSVNEVLEGVYRSLPRSSDELLDIQSKNSVVREIDKAGDIIRQDALGKVGILALISQKLSIEEGISAISSIVSDQVLIKKDGDQANELEWTIYINGEVKVLRAALESIYLSDEQKVFAKTSFSENSKFLRVRRTVLLN